MSNKVKLVDSQSLSGKIKRRLNYDAAIVWGGLAVSVVAFWGTVGYLANQNADKIAHTFKAAAKALVAAGEATKEITPFLVFRGKPVALVFDGVPRIEFVTAISRCLSSQCISNTFQSAEPFRDSNATMGYTISRRPLGSASKDHSPKTNG